MKSYEVTENNCPACGYEENNYSDDSDWEEETTGPDNVVFNIKCKDCELKYRVGLRPFIISVGKE